MTWSLGELIPQPVFDASMSIITFGILCITLGDGVDPTEIDLEMTNNQNVDETKLNNVIDAHLWYRRFFGS
mgnify:CR=1 FL=1